MFKYSKILIKENTDLSKRGVYRITNKITGIIYIGSTCRSFKNRISDHQTQSRDKNPVAQLLNNKVINVFGSMRLADFELSGELKSYSAIAESLSGKRKDKLVYGFEWSYITKGEYLNFKKEKNEN